MIKGRIEQLGAPQEGGPTPVIDAMFSREEPRTTAPPSKRHWWWRR